MNREYDVKTIDSYKRKSSTDYLTFIPILNDEKQTIGFL